MYSLLYYKERKKWKLMMNKTKYLQKEDLNFKLIYKNYTK